MRHAKILTGGNHIYLDVVDKIKSKVEKNERISLRKDTLEDYKSYLTSKPFFSPYYCVDITLSSISNKEIKLIKEISSLDNCQVIVVCEKFKDFKKLDRFDFISFNGYRPKTKYVREYVSSRLKKSINNNALELFIKKVAPRYDMLDFYIDKLNNVKAEVLTSQIIGKNVEASDKLSFDKFFYNLIWKKDLAKCIDFSSEYEYGSKYVLKFIRGRMEELLEYYKLFYEGEFNRLNLIPFSAQQNEPEYKMSKMLDVFETFSYAELIEIKRMINEAGNEHHDLLRIIIQIQHRVRLEVGA